MSQLEFEQNGDTVYIRFTDARILDEAEVQEIGEGLMDLVERSTRGGQSTVVDLQGVQFMSSAMIGKLILLNKVAGAGRRDLTLRNVCPNVMQVFRVMRLDKVFRFDAVDGAEAVADPPGQPSRSSKGDVDVSIPRRDEVPADYA